MENTAEVKAMVARQIADVWGDEVLTFSDEKLKNLMKQAEMVIRLTKDEVKDGRIYQ